MNNQSLGRRVKQYRKKQGLTQQQLAERLDMAESYLSAIENGRRLPGRGTLLKLSKELDVSLDGLLSPQTDKGVALESNELYEILCGLSPSNQELVLEMVRFLCEKLR